MARLLDDELTRWLPVLDRRDATARHLRVLADPLTLPMRQLAGHQHPVPTLVLPLRGSARLTWRGGVVVTGEDEALFLAPCTRHRHEFQRPGDVVFHLGFKGVLCDIAVQLGEARHEAHIAGRRLRRLVDALPSLQSQRQRRCLRTILRRVSTARRVPTPTPHPAVSRMTHHLWWHYDEAIDAGDVIAASGLGRSQAIHRFTQAYGHGPARELQRLRLESARYLLAGGLSVAATAQRCGYRDRRSFSRAYRRFYGHEPSRCR